MDLSEYRRLKARLRLFWHLKPRNCSLTPELF